MDLKELLSVLEIADFNAILVMVTDQTRLSGIIGEPTKSPDFR